MKTMFTIILTWLTLSHSVAQSDRNITDINDSIVGVKSLQGKKILLLVLPLQKDTAIINQLLRFKKRYEMQVHVIGLVNTTQGSPTKENYREAYYEASKAGITITEGLQPAENVSDARESVIIWISGKNTNRQRDQYATGSKYFISEEGRLYAQLGKEVSLDATIVKNIINANVPKAIIRTKKEGMDAGSKK